MIKATSNLRGLACTPTLAIIFTLASSAMLLAQPDEQQPEVQLPPLAAPEIGIDETLLDDLRPPKKPRLGLIVEELTDQLASHIGIDKGVYVTSVQANGPAAEAGITSGDVITQVGQRAVTSIGELMAAVAEIDEGAIGLTIQDDDGSKTVDVTPLMVAEEPVAQDRIPGNRPGPNGGLSDRGPGAAPSITGDLIQQMMRQFGGDLNGNTIRDLGGLAEQLMRRGAGAPRSPAMRRSLKIEIDRGDDGRSKVFVDVDGRTYSADDQNLDGLPDNVRGVVSDLLGNGRSRRVFDLGDIHIDLDPERGEIDGVVPTPEPPPVRNNRRPAGPNDRERQSLNSQVDQLQRQIDELRRSLPRQRPDHREFD